MLAYAQSACDGLIFDARIPLGLHNEYSICCGEIQAVCNRQLYIVAGEAILEFSS